MNGEGFAFFRWRVLSHDYVGGDAEWWAYWCRYDHIKWSALQAGPLVLYASDMPYQRVL